MSPKYTPEEVVPLFDKLYEKFKETWLWRLFLSHRRRIVVSSGVSLLGSSLLIIAVTRLEINASLANVVLSPVMFFIGFFVVRKYAFADRGTSAMPGLSKWSVKWLMMTPISQPAFVWLVESHGWNFMLARVAVGAATCLPGYTLTNLFVFAQKGFGVKWASRQVRVLAIRAWTFGIEKA